MLLPVLLIIAAKSGIVGYISDSLDVNDSLHRLTSSGDRDEIVALSHSSSHALATAESTATTATTLRLLARRRFGRTKIDLTWHTAKSTGTAGAATTWTTGPPTTLRLHSLTKRAHPCRVTTLTHRVHRIAHVTHRSRIHSRKISSSARGITASGAK